MQLQHVTFCSISRRVICILVILSLGQCIQLKNVDLSTSQRNISSSSASNVTRLKVTDGDLRPLFTNDSDVLSQNRASVYKKSVLFSQWTTWSDCDKRCKQRRSRKCLKGRKCGSVKQIEERKCEAYLCTTFRNPTEKNHENLKFSHNRKSKRKKLSKAYELNDDEFFRTKRHNKETGSRIVMKVVKQGNFRYNRKSGGSDVEREFFLPKSRSLRSFSNDDDDDDYNDVSDNDEDAGSDDENYPKIKAVFEAPRKPPLSNYSKWSRWSKCSPKCVTRRYKKCRPHARQICGTDIIREIAYCYTEGSFCEEWISSQINRINEAPTTVRPTKPARRTESPLSNTISPNFYGSSYTGRRKSKVNGDVRPQTLQCGFPSIRNKSSDFTLKIIGGRASRRGTWPWQVAILNRYKEAFCGGTLISHNWVLTASHCVRKRLYVILGEHNLNVKEGSEIEFRIHTAIKHPKYNKKTVDSDIALLKLPQKVDRSHYIGFACLPEKTQQLPVGSLCTVIGWGKKRHSDETGTSLLHEANVPIISNDACRNVYYDYVITKNMFCAGGHRRDTCSGDSGGPILCRDSKKSNRPWTVFGITSFGDGCGKKNKFGIYTKITNYVDFIWSTVNCNGICENKNTF